MEEMMYYWLFIQYQGCSTLSTSTRVSYYGCSFVYWLHVMVGCNFMVSMVHLV
jgi:hypothetical protein